MWKQINVSLPTFPTHTHAHIQGDSNNSRKGKKSYHHSPDQQQEQQRPNFRPVFQSIIHSKGTLFLRNVLQDVLVCYLSLPLFFSLVLPSKESNDKALPHRFTFASVSAVFAARGTFPISTEHFTRKARLEANLEIEFFPKLALTFSVQ